MAEPIIPKKAKLFAGIITASGELALSAEVALVKKYGDIDFKTAKIPFAHTEYYGGMGRELFRIFLSFRKLVRREDIVAIKLFANRLEKRISEKGKRAINIDPGYLTLSNVYLASCKEYFHRAYLRDGVYLENEYRFVARRYEPWDWTYPDYRSREYLDFFHGVRRLYAQQLKDA
ncbi:MAG TPA: DUF4416 family protein [Spirochaetota bacterium]|nr:DUF4416 family protein [Spirochaetota bacterium]OPZ39544.1 MAG: hypothetical protein BWY96_00133 [Spirochaetes bacterium ADurb.BinA120]HNU91108.1 DUF4416 family protein [Spirochaetota bacterium]HPI14124.1 DUF4416 family protein [Spirochaetota bacterium]HPO45163.1 DUF4416 family protein [Spirochaetota bacterium]